MIFEYGNLNMKDCRLSLQKKVQKLQCYNEDERVENAKKLVNLNDISHVVSKILYLLSNKKMFALAVRFRRMYTLLSQTVHMILYTFRKKSE